MRKILSLIVLMVFAVLVLFNLIGFFLNINKPDRLSAMEVNFRYVIVGSEQEHLIPALLNGDSDDILIFNEEGISVADGRHITFADDPSTRLVETSRSNLSFVADIYNGNWTIFWSGQNLDEFHSIYIGGVYYLIVLTTEPNEVLLVQENGQKTLLAEGGEDNEILAASFMQDENGKWVVVVAWDNGSFTFTEI